MPVLLNGLKLEFSALTFSANKRGLSDPNELKALREQHGAEWFTHWRQGTLYAIPRVERPAAELGKPATLECADHEHLHVLTARLSDCLPNCFPQYDAFRHKPFAFLGKKDEFVARITQDWHNVHPLIQRFEIRPKFELDPRIIELRDGETEAAIFLAISTRWECHAALDELANAGVDVGGLYVIRREPLPGQRRLVGQVASIEGGTVRLAESFDEITSVRVDEVWLEGSRTSFSRCLSKLLGTRFRDFENFRDVEQSEFLTGPGVDQVLSKMESVLRKTSPIRLTEDLTVAIAGRIAIANSSNYKTVVRLKPSQYCFDPARTKRSDYAWSGLERFGPYDRESFAKRTPKILVVCPDSLVGRVSQSLKSFRDGISATSKPVFEKGFANTFHLINPDFTTIQVSLFGKTPSEVVAAYRQAIEDHLARNPAYDAAITVLLDEHATVPDSVNPYVHSKAVLLANGIPVQEFRRATITAPETSLQYIFQNIGVALYAKMGGVPWTVDHGLTVDDEIVIGMGTAELSGSRFEKRHRHIGITTVFRGDGNYLLANLSKECSYEQYPDVLKTSTRDVLREIKHRNAWRHGDTVRVVFHAFKPLKDVEVAEIVKSCVEEVGNEQTIEFAFLTVSFDHPFKLIDTAQQGRPARRDGQLKGVYVPDRGLMCQLGRFTRLLCTNGPTLIKKPTTPLPSPILVHLHRESTYRDLPYLTDQVLKFTTLSWRSTLPAERPVTIYYSELIAELLARLQVVPGWSPAVLNTKLRTSKWFL